MERSGVHFTIANLNWLKTKVCLLDLFTKSQQLTDDAFQNSCHFCEFWHQNVSSINKSLSKIRMEFQIFIERTISFFTNL
jgi:hypothetical protein